MGLKTGFQAVCLFLLLGTIVYSEKAVDSFDTEDDYFDDGDEGQLAASNGQHFDEVIVPGQISVFVQYCSSWNYKNNFMYLKQFLEKAYPELKNNIAGANYPAPEYVEILISAVAVLQVSCVLLMVFARPISEMLGLTEVPQLLQEMQRNQIQVFMGLFILSSIIQNLRSTGAFEIIVNGKVIFSKLEVGRMPQLREITVLLEQYGLTPIESVRSSLDRHV